jgi:hypothetical protein
MSRLTCPFQKQYPPPNEAAGAIVVVQVAQQQDQGSAIEVLDRARKLLSDSAVLCPTSTDATKLRQKILQEIDLLLKGVVGRATGSIELT